MNKPMMTPRRTLAVLLTALAPFAARAERLLNEPFDYPDGAIVTVAQGLWLNHSGTAEQSSVESGAAFITGTEAEDVNRTFSPTVINNCNLYA